MTTRKAARVILTIPVGFIAFGFELLGMLGEYLADWREEFVHGKD